MAGGWAKDGAVQDQIDASVEEAVSRARGQIAPGESLAECEECGAPILEARRKAIPGVRRCVPCQETEESQHQYVDSINRRASKDSQLR